MQASNAFGQAIPAPAPSPNGFALSQAEQQQLIAQLPALHAMQLPFVNGAFAGAPSGALQYAAATSASAAFAQNAAAQNALMSQTGGLLLQTSPATLAALQQHMRSMQELNVNAPPYTGPSALQMQARAAAASQPQSVLFVNGGGLQSVPSMNMNIGMNVALDSAGSGCSSFGGGASGSESSADSGTAAFYPQAGTATAATLASDQVRLRRLPPVRPGPHSTPYTVTHTDF